MTDKCVNCDAKDKVAAESISLVTTFKAEANTLKAESDANKKAKSDVETENVRLKAELEAERTKEKHFVPEAFEELIDHCTDGKCPTHATAYTEFATKLKKEGADEYAATLPKPETPNPIADAPTTTKPKTFLEKLRAGAAK